MAADDDPLIVERESDLYPMVERYLSLDFQRSIEPLRGSHFFIVEQTHNSRVGLRGRWAHPDLIGVCIWRRKYSARVEVDLYSFEVKKRSGTDLRAAHEAFSHNRFSHYAILIWNISPGDSETNNFRDVREACLDLGIGLISTSRPDDRRSYEINVQARRKKPDLDLIDEMIEAKLSDRSKEIILQQLKHALLP